MGGQASTSGEILIWDLPTRLFHWGLVTAVSIGVLSAQVGGAWMAVHGAAGLCVVGLLVFRLLWGVWGHPSARFRQFTPSVASVKAYLCGNWRGVGHNPLGALSVYALLLLLAVQAGTGLFSSDDIAYAGPLADRAAADMSWLTGWHRRVAMLLLGFIGLHMSAIVLYALLKRRNLVSPMISGRGPVEAGTRVPQGLGRRTMWMRASAAASVAVAVSTWLAWIPCASSAGTASSPPQGEAPAPPAW